MKDPYTLLLKLLGYEKREPSPLLRYMSRFTHSNWITDLRNNGRISEYEYSLYSK